MIDTTPTVRLDVREGTATITIDNPRRRNAMTLEMWRQLADHCLRLATAGAHVVVVRGSGAHFCAGADLSELSEGVPASYREANLAAIQALSDLPMPTVAFIRGACVGGGVQIATSCGLRLAATSTTLGIPAVRLGVIYPAASLTQLAQLVGIGRARRLLSTAEMLDADRALEMGLVDLVRTDGESEAALADLVVSLSARRSRNALQAVDQMLADIAAHGVVQPETVAHWSRTEAVSS